MSTEKFGNITDLESLSALIQDVIQRTRDGQDFTAAEDILGTLAGLLFNDGIADAEGRLLIANVKFSQDQREAIAALLSCNGDEQVLALATERIENIVESVLPDAAERAEKVRQRLAKEEAIFGRWKAGRGRKS